MNWLRHSLKFETREPIEVLELTEEIRKFVFDRSLKDGLLLVASPHTTMGVVINENCPKLNRDIVAFLKKLAPPEAKYFHNEDTVDGRPNAHSHLLSMVVPNQVTIAVNAGKLDLGTWQSVFAVELDGPRFARQVNLSFLGETNDL